MVRGRAEPLVGSGVLFEHLDNLLQPFCIRRWRRVGGVGPLEPLSQTLLDFWGDLEFSSVRAHSKAKGLDAVAEQLGPRSLGKPQLVFPPLKRSAAEDRRVKREALRDRRARSHAHKGDGGRSDKLGLRA